MSNPQLLIGVFLIGLIVTIGVFQLVTKPADDAEILSVDSLSARSTQMMEGMSLAPILSTRTGEASWLRLTGFQAPLHYHGQSEFLFMLSGSGAVIHSDGSREMMSPGQLLMVPAGVPLGFEASGDFLAFATPPGEETVFLEGPNSQEGAEAPVGGSPEVIDVLRQFDQGLDSSADGMSSSELFRSETGSLSLIRLEGRVPRHSVSYDEVVYGIRGRTQVVIGGKTMEIGPGEIVILPAGIPHEARRIGSEPSDVLVFSTPPPSEH